MILNDQLRVGKERPASWDGGDHEERGDSLGQVIEAVTNSKVASLHTGAIG